MEEIGVLGGDDRVPEHRRDLFQRDPAMAAQGMHQAGIALLVLGVDPGHLSEDVVQIVRKAGNGRHGEVEQHDGHERAEEQHAESCIYHTPDISE